MRGEADEIFGRYIVYYDTETEKEKRNDGLKEELFEQLEITKNDNSLHRQFDKKMHDVLLSQFKMASRKINEEFPEEKIDSGKVMSKEEAVFWISFFERSVEKFAKKRKKRKKSYYECNRICSMLWEKWFSYIAVKYIELGKAVYYFGTPNLYSKLKFNEEIVVGSVLEEYTDGLTSFDYEKIKADESLVRNIATSVTFAANAFAAAACNQQFREEKDSNSDVFAKTLMKPGAMRDGAMKRILCYFGGSSFFEEELRSVKLKTDAEEKFCLEIAEHIENLRNTSYHFSTDRSAAEAERGEWVLKIFANEYKRVNYVIGERYMSNNVAMFYSEKQLYRMMKKLYALRIVYEAQIPAFNSIVKKKDIREMIDSKWRNGNKKNFNIIYADVDILKKYESSLFFVLKEIYYYGFLREDNLLERFTEAVLKFSKSNIIDTVERQARSSFLKRCGELGIISYSSDYDHNKRCFVEKAEKREEKCRLTFGQVCQQIMTDYNMQNQGQKEIVSVEKRKWQEKSGLAPIYEHYVILLKKCVRDAFEAYLADTSEFTFLMWPELKKDTMKKKYVSRVSVDEFINGMPEIGIFSELNDLLLKGNEECQEEKDPKHNMQLMYDWYISAHFMNAKQLNLLMGDLKSYKAFVNDICNRAKNTGNEKVAERIQKAYDEQRYSDILMVLEFVIRFVGKVGKNIDDYFGLGKNADAKEEYAEYLRQFVDFDSYVSTNISNKPNKNGLLEFCGDISSGAGAVNTGMGIYFDEENPIVNKNVIYSLLYGDGNMLKACFKDDRISLNEIIGKQEDSYYSLAKSLTNAFRNGKCETVKEQNDMRQFQNLKNRIELLDLQVYTEIVNDFIAQMISWAYLRERDLLHFQLGFHYVRLFFTDYLQNSRVKEYNELSRLNITKGAILYQILAIYDHELPILKIDSKKGSIEKVEHQTPGPCVIAFCKTYGENTYNAGQQFFGEEKRRDYFVRLRDYIDHMRYYTKHDRSIFELLGEMYNGFMIYDTKLKKSVSFITKNILERYHVVANTHMKHADEENPDFMYTAELYSDKYTYKGSFKYTYYDKKAKKTVGRTKKIMEVNSRSGLFIELLGKILSYKR